MIFRNRAWPKARQSPLMATPFHYIILIKKIVLFGTIIFESSIEDKRFNGWNCYMLFQGWIVHFAHVATSKTILPLISDHLCIFFYNNNNIRIMIKFIECNCWHSTNIVKHSKMAWIHVKFFIQVYQRSVMDQIMMYSTPTRL